MANTTKRDLKDKLRRQKLYAKSLEETLRGAPRRALEERIKELERKVKILREDLEDERGVSAALRERMKDLA